MKVFIQRRRKVWELERSEVEVPEGTPHDQVEGLAMDQYHAGRGSYDTPVVDDTCDDEVFVNMWWEGKPKP